jgi:hypothetical protein
VSRKKWLFVAVAALFVLSVAVTGCGESATTEEPIKVGVPEKITGPYANDARVSMEGITMAIE